MTNANDIPVANTPAGGYGASFPPLILGGCTEPLAPGAPDLRGIWKTISATRGGEPVPADDRLMSYSERIEQCGNRIPFTHFKNMVDNKFSRICIQRELISVTPLFLPQRYE